MADVSSRSRLSTFAALARSFGLSLLLLLVAPRALAADVNLAWDPVASGSLAGYMVYYGPVAGTYPNSIDVGNTTTYTVTGLTEGSTYHFVVTAYDASHAESGFSNDASTTVPYSAPVAQFTGSPTSGTFPLTVNFSNTSTGSITSYAWDFGDTGTSAAANPSHVYAAAGTYTVKLTVTGPGGSDTQTRTSYITVSATPAPVAQFTGSPTSGTFPLTVNFSNTSTGSITSYAWDFGDTGTSAAANPSHVYAAAGTYTVKLTVTGPGGSDPLTRTNYVTVGTAPPVAQFTGSPTSGTFPLTVNFSNTSTGSITSYAWDFGDTGTSAAANPSHVYAAAGTYTVKLTVTGPGGSDPLTRTNYVTVGTAPPVAQFTGSPTSGTFPLTVNFSNTSTGSITSYAWDFGDTGTSAAANPSHVYAAAGTYTVKLTVTGPGGSDPLTRTNYVTVGTAPPVAQFTGSPTSGTFPLTVNFSNTSTGSITSYAWDFGDTGTSAAANPSHVYAAAGTYTVKLTVTGPGGSDTQTRTSYITVSATPAPVAQFTGSPTSGTFPLTVNFSNTSTGSITSYAWDFGDTGTSAAANPSHVYAAAGTYTVKLTVTGPGGSDPLTRTNYVTVGTAPPVAQFTGSPTSGTFPLTVNFSNTSTGSITSYAWDFGDTGTSAAANPSHVYAAAGTYTVKLTVTGPGGSDPLTRTNYVTVSTVAPVAQFTGTPTKGKAPQTVAFTNASTGSITSYAWDFGDGTTSPAANPSKVYSASGVYTVALSVTGPGGSNTKTQTNYVKVTPRAKFSASATTGVAPLTVNFADESMGGGVTSYAWDFGDGTVSTLANPGKVYSVPGVYTVTLTVTGVAGSDTQTISDYVSVTLPPDVGLYRTTAGLTKPPYRYLLDYNFDHVPDVHIQYGAAGDVPLVGYMSPGGKSSLIIYRNGLWYLDTNRDGTADAVVVLGGGTRDIPLTANFTGAGGLDDIVIYRDGVWYVDTNLNGSVDLMYTLGGVDGDVPLAADVDDDGIADLAIYRKGTWYIDTHRNGTVAMTLAFGGLPEDIPLLFDWDGDGKADLCIFRDGIWYVSTKRDGVADVIFGFGAAGDLPMLGKFQ